MVSINHVVVDVLMSEFEKTLYGQVNSALKKSHETGQIIDKDEFIKFCRNDREYSTRCATRHHIWGTYPWEEGTIKMQERDAFLNEIEAFAANQTAKTLSFKIRA